VGAFSISERYPLLVLSHVQAAPLLAARQSGQASATTSADLGLSTLEARLEPQGVAFPTGEQVTWAGLETIQSNPSACFQIEGGAPKMIRGFSELTGRYYSLYPTRSAPTLLVAGFPMHRIKDTDPHRDTLSKIKAIAPVGGRVLDTTTGLGYTAIEAARTASHVTSLELDPVAQDMARLNPWSQALFDNPKISLMIGDSFEASERFEAGAFSCIIHDPPTFRLAGDLYSGEFYRQAFRVLKTRGRMFHYIGDPESQSGRRVSRGVVRRLQEAGFSRVKPAPAAFGVVAYK
jgi:uncharacterized protein